MLMFTSAVPEAVLYRAGKLYGGRPLQVKTRAELLASIKPHHWKYLREEAGDLPGERPQTTGRSPAAGVREVAVG